MDPARIAITGAAGQIGYHLAFAVAGGAVLGPRRPVVLQLLEVEGALGALEGVAMELHDGAFELLAGVVCTHEAERAFEGADHALLVGARPRGPGMERADLLEANAPVFARQGRALAREAAPGVSVTVVGNPANSNALVALRHASGLDLSRFSAMTRLDHNRTKAQLAARAQVSVSEVSRVIVWGNHSASQYPDVGHALVGGRPAFEVVGEGWVAEHLVPTVQGRGAAVIEARGASSAASAARAAAEHLRDWVAGTPPGDWVSMAVVSDGSYGVPEGLVSSFPVVCAGGRWSVVPGLVLDATTRAGIAASVAELVGERDALQRLGLLVGADPQ